MSIRVGMRAMARIVGAAARPPPDEYVDANIFSAYSLTSTLPPEELAVSLTSVYTLSILVAKMVASPAAPGISLGSLVSSVLTPTPASVYSLSTAVT